MSPSESTHHGLRSARPALPAVLAGAAALFLGIALHGAEPAAQPADANPVPVHTVAPEHPAALLETKTGGEVEIECIVNEAGEVTEAQVHSATHPELGEAALAAIKQWKFTPAMRDGHPVPMRVSVPFSFSVPDEANLEALLKRKVFVEVTEQPVPAETLGSWPMPRRMVEPRYPRELRGSGKRGKAVISVVIDKEGRVINPRLVKATFPEFEAPALAAAASLEFPPQLNAKKERIYVSMDVQFDFREGGRPKPSTDAAAKGHAKELPKAEPAKPADKHEDTPI